MRRWLLAMVFLSTGLSPSFAVAQDAATLEHARALFEAGVEALDAGRFAEAAPLLERSLALNPRPSVAFNLAFARVGMGQPVEARRVLDRLLAGDVGPVDPDLRARAEAKRAEATSMIAHLDVLPEPVEADVRVDGAPTPSPVGLELDPGPHVIDVTARGFLDHQRALRLPPGARRTLRVTLSEAPPPAAPIEESEWFWGTLAAVAAIGVVGVVVGVALYEDGQPDVDFTVPALSEVAW